MPYLPVELDALNKFSHVAAAGGVDRPVVTDGMVFMWAYCFREDTDRVSRVHIKGFFGVDITDALLAFGFVEPAEAVYRVKGAEEKLLAQRRARRAGGLAAKGNLKRGTRHPAGTEAGDPAGAPPPAALRLEPGCPPGLTPALTPNTQHPTPNTLEAVVAAPAADPVSAMGAAALAPAAVRELADRRKPSVPLVLEEPPEHPESWDGQHFWHWFQVQRQLARLPCERERPDPRKLSSWWSVCLMTPGVDVWVLRRAVSNVFGRDKHWEAQGFPFRAFMAQWDQFVSKEVARATASR